MLTVALSPPLCILAPPEAVARCFRPGIMLFETGEPTGQ
jgi:hypothetical protein